MAATAPQVEFFEKLLADREFPDGTNTDALLGQFRELTPAAASTWIDKARALPRTGAGEGQEGKSLAPPF